jgi:hypothetical protein
MAYIDEPQVQVVVDGTLSRGDIKRAISRILWGFYKDHSQDSITIKKWFISITVKVEQLRSLFVAIAGEPDGAPLV